jgi:hypothetical protein
MTPEERARVEETIRSIRGVYSGCIYFFIQLVGGAVLGMLASGIPGAILQWLGAPDSVTQAVIVVGTISGFLLGVRSVRKDRWEGVRLHQLDLAENVIQEIHCTALDAVRVAPFSDEGPGFFLDVGDSKLLFVQGQSFEDFALDESDEADEDELDEAEHDVSFPCRELHITRTPHGGLTFVVECLGEPLEPSRVREPLDGQTEYVPENGEIITGSLATLEADLRHLRQR